MTNLEKQLPENMTIEEALQWTLKQLEDEKIPNAYMESSWILEDITKIQSTKLMMHSDKILDTDQKALLASHVNKRMSHKPLAYILGHIPFHNISVFVDEGVLIPRPETEELVELSLNHVYKQDKGLLLDLGCGSGCIGIAIAKEMVNWQIHMSDISQRALEITQKNIFFNLGEAAMERFKVIESDLFTGIDSQNVYDLIVSNPPYIFPDEKNSMDADVLDNEPHLALFHADPVDLFQSMLKESSKRLHPQGCFIAELSPRIALEVLEESKKYFQDCQIIKDLSGKDRFIFCKTLR